MKLRKITRFFVMIIMWLIGFEVIQYLCFERVNPIGTVYEIATRTYSYDMFLFLAEIIIFTLFFLVFVETVGQRLIGIKLIKNPQSFSAINFSVLTFFLILIAVSLYFFFSADSHIKINEISVNNRTVTINDNWDVANYVELYNAGRIPYELNMLYLSDDEKHLKKQCIEEYYFNPGEHLVFAFDEDKMSFGNTGNEEVILSNRNGEILDRITIPRMYYDDSYSRYPDGSDEWTEALCTPWIENANVTTLPLPEFRTAGGFYDSPVEISIEVADKENVKIIYTLNGDNPSLENGIVYDGKLQAQSGITIVTAATMSEDGRVSDSVSRTYFVGVDLYKDQPVVSLVIDPNDLNGERGIFTNNLEHGRDWERDAYLEIYGNNISVAQKAGIRLSGASAREADVKRFSIYARKKYDGSSTFNKRLFDKVDSHSFFLRNGSNNAFCLELLKGRAFATEQAFPVYEFVNGEYYDDTYLIEKYNSRFFKEYYGVDKEDIVIVKGSSIATGTDADYETYKAIYDYLEQNDLSIDENYDAFCDIIDIDSYTEYMAANMYLKNTDFDEAKNVYLFKSRSGAYDDGRWNWCLYDLDFCCLDEADVFSVDSNAAINPFTVEPRFAVPISQQPIFMALSDNAQFRRKYAETVEELERECFNSYNIRSVLDKLHIDDEVSEEWIDFFEQRPKYMQEFIDEWRASYE